MRLLALIVLALCAASPAPAQDGGEIPPAPDGGMPPPAEAGPPAGEVFAEWDEVEVLDIENDIWDPCRVLAVFPGAYKVSCNYETSLRRDMHVRKPGAAGAAQSAAQPVSGPPFKRNDLVLVTTMGLPDDWKLCIVLRNEVAKSNSYLVDCGTEIRVLPKWVRKDPKAP